jgi:activator of HSP90 ATPase
MSKIEGEATANNRKCKLIFLYEWVLKGEWKGFLKTECEEYKGTFEVPNLSDEYDAEDLEVSVSLTDDKPGKNAHQLKDFMRKTGAEKIKELLAIYITGLKTEFSQGMILSKEFDKKAVPNQNNLITDKCKQNEMKQKMNKPITSSNNINSAVKIQCKKLKLTEEFQCQVQDVYRALTEKDMLRAFTQSDVEIKSEKSGRFSLFGGNVVGEFVKLIPNEKLEMKWRFKSWPFEHYSEVVIDFEEKESSTILKLSQIGIPQEDYEKTKEGWKIYYWQPMRQRLGFGATLF